MFKCTKKFSQPLQPSCDAQDTAICWQVDQNGTHITTVLPPIRERLSLDAKQGLIVNKTYYHWTTCSRTNYGVILYAAVIGATAIFGP